MRLFEKKFQTQKSEGDGGFEIFHPIFTEDFKMDFFKEYGYTQEEILSNLSDAINLIDKTDDPDGVADKLADTIVILKREWSIED